MQAPQGRKSGLHETEDLLKRVAFHTLGCKVNAYETEAMQQELLKAGYVLCSFEEQADVYVINTCTVTNIADRKSRQMIHRAKHLNPDSVVVAAGCYVQAAGDKLKKDSCIDLLIGNDEKKDIAAILDACLSHREKTAAEEIGNISEVRTYDSIPADAMEDHTRAFLKIQDGCNQFCSYCIIPYVRGRVRSREKEDILHEARSFAEKGYRELVLTGIHLSSYGTDLTGEGNDLPELIRELDKLEGIRRIRLGSLEPEIITEDFLDRLREIPSFCPHFHLALQSGCDAVLKRMNRHYTTAGFLKGTEKIRRRFPEAALTTDVITGFPGETEEEFLSTVRFLKQVRFYETHIFPYSRREGTKADRMPDQLSAAVKAARAEVLAGLNKEMSKAYRTGKTGTECEALLEQPVMIGGEKYFAGNTREYVKVAVPFLKGQENMLVRGKITRFLTPEIMLLDEIIDVS
jgi:threonylcarbamoyladenosine tRNA methylthiotransferase MtaB